MLRHVGTHSDTSARLGGIIPKFANVLKNRTMRVFAAITRTCGAAAREHAIDLYVLSALG